MMVKGGASCDKRCGSSAARLAGCRATVTGVCAIETARGRNVPKISVPGRSLAQNLVAQNLAGQGLVAQAGARLTVAGLDLRV